MKTVPVSSFPEDFQQLLCDMFAEQGLDNQTILTVKVEPGWVSDHVEEIEQDVDCWAADDFEKAAEYASAMLRGDKFPPLVADTAKGLLRDGYHRSYAYREIGVSVTEFIYLDSILRIEELDV